MTAKERVILLHPELGGVWDALKEKKLAVPEMAPQPEVLKLKLLPFQREGLSWLKKQEETGFHGGILADEMGMGKTIQVISLLVSKRGDLPSLVICPVVALLQWKAEILNHTNEGTLKVGVFYGKQIHFSFPLFFHTNHFSPFQGTEKKEKPEELKEFFARRHRNFHDARAGGFQNFSVHGKTV